MSVNQDFSPQQPAKENFNKMRMILSDLNINENLFYLDIDQKETKTRLLQFINYLTSCSWYLLCIGQCIKT